MLGPTAKLELSCFHCDFCKTESYTCQGDSGTDVFCIHSESLQEVNAEKRRIGDTKWTTPDWCPLREKAINDLFDNIKKI